MATVSDTLIWLIFLALLYYALYYTSVVVGYLRDSRRLGKKLDRFPGPPTHWLFGNLQNMRPDEASIAIRRGMAERYRRVVRMWIGPFKAILLVCHPDTVKTVLMSTEAKPVGFGGAYSMLPPWLGEGLLVSSGSKWFRNRKLLTPAFHFDVLKPYLKIYNEAFDVFMEKIEATTGKSLEIFQPLSLCTLNIILRCAFSYEADVQKERSNAYATAVEKLAHLIVNRGYKPYLHMDWLYYMTSNGREFRRLLTLLHDTSSGIIAARRKALLNDVNRPTKKHPDFLDILLLSKDEDGTGLSDAEIRDEVDTFLFLGHDTITSALSWLMYEMARNADHQERCRQEVMSLFDGRSEKDMTWEDLHKVPHITMCIKEAMRLHNPVPYIVRHTVHPFQLDGLTVPKGTDITIGFFVLHWNREVWGDDVMEFRPERFTHDEMKNRDSHAFVPFSAGSRNCIGQNFAMNEIKVAIGKILHRFDLKLDPDHHVEHRMELVMRSPNGIKIFFTPRT